MKSVSKPKNPIKIWLKSFQFNRFLIIFLIKFVSKIFYMRTMLDLFPNIEILLFKLLLESILAHKSRWGSDKTVEFPINKFYKPIK